MKKKILVGIFFTVTFLNLILFNAWTNAAVYDELVSNTIGLEEDIELPVAAPGILNNSLDFLSRLDYDNSIVTDRRFKWKVTSYEKTDNFHISEGDKKLKINDKIIIIIGANPELQLPDVHNWCLVYVNDVMARYHSTDEHKLAVFKYIHPSRVNVSGFTDVYDLGYIDYWEYLERSTLTNTTIWTFEEDVYIYSNTVVTEDNNVTTMQLTYDKNTGFLNEMDYSVSYINSTGFPAGVNLSIVRLHGFGLRYNISTWLIWTPLILVFVGLIVALRMRLFQRLRLYREARKLAKRE